MLKPEPELLQAIADSNGADQNTANQVLDSIEQLVGIFNSPEISNGSLEEKQKSAAILNQIKPKIESLATGKLKTLLQAKYNQMVERKRSF